MNNLHNIVVYIKDEAMLQEARGILERYGQDIGSLFALSSNISGNYLYYCEYLDEWNLSIDIGYIKITLTELEQILKQQYEGNKQIAINLTKGA